MSSKRPRSPLQEREVGRHEPKPFELNMKIANMSATDITKYVPQLPAKTQYFDLRELHDLCLNEHTYWAPQLKTWREVGKS